MSLGLVLLRCWEAHMVRRGDVSSLPLGAASGSASPVVPGRSGDGLKAGAAPVLLDGPRGGWRVRNVMLWLLDRLVEFATLSAVRLPASWWRAEH